MSAGIVTRGKATFKKQASFTANAQTLLLDLTAAPCTLVTVQAKATGITAWSIAVEVSLDGTNYETVATHTNLTPGDGKTVTATGKVFDYVRLTISGITGSGSVLAIARVLQ